ncbi:hypothetical protein NDI37_00910 [Funiculus sociatus GB2-A5]|uniref:Uncharacterized protein n=1 Tax=Funiculus sociatus GB2-A5 TaxID=2933946 RepID=A0ABV0JJZ3_9CYAN|nr:MULTISPECIES: hypothetical protein [unclassified Trichocoleus]MBD1904529.1 hypothetical protein [Trichocoleus sp. FACHB-832]MBD2064460.1 hypothetical protein [Trichocoleus sp. FACHB-6]
MPQRHNGWLIGAIKCDSLAGTHKSAKLSDRAIQIAQYHICRQVGNNS